MILAIHFEEEKALIKDCIYSCWTLQFYGQRFYSNDGKIKIKGNFSDRYCVIDRFWPINAIITNTSNKQTQEKRKKTSLNNLFVFMSSNSHRRVFRSIVWTRSTLLTLWYINNVFFVHKYGCKSSGTLFNYLYIDVILL